MTRRYNLSHPAGQPMPEDWIHLPDSVVAAADYDAVSARLAEAETNAEWAQHWKDKHDTVEAEIERLRAGLQLIADDKNRLMNEVARQTAASILGGKPIGEVPEWPTREEAEKRAAELMAIGLYNELLYAVASKYPGESRHDTALRYIRDRETRASNGPSQAVEPKP